MQKKFDLPKKKGDSKIRDDDRQINTATLCGTNLTRHTRGTTNMEGLWPAKKLSLVQSHTQVTKK